MERIRARRVTHADRLAGDIDSRFDFDRAQLFETVGKAAERTVHSYDIARESETMAESVRMAVIGLFVIPARRAQATTAMRARSKPRGSSSWRRSRRSSTVRWSGA